MKRFLSLLLGMTLALTLSACGGNAGAGGTDAGSAGGTDAAALPADANALLTAVWDSYTDEEKFPASGGDSAAPVEDAPGPVDHTDADDLTYLLTVPEAETGKVTDAAALTHMMNLNTFTCSALRTEDTDAAAALAAAMRDAIQAKHWMCGFPEKLVIFTLGDYVVSMYGNEDLCDTFRDKLQAAWPDAAVAYQEAIEV